MKKMKKIIYVIFAIIFISCAAFFKSDEKLINYVDPFIGSGGHGHVFVGANVPFGGVQVGQQILIKDGIGHHHITILTV